MTDTAPGRRGRRRGSPDTRAAILTAARGRFADSGFAGTTIRGVAADAGVDPALVHHYFGSKDDLFLAALELPVDPRQLILARVLEPPAAAAEELGERLLRTFLSAWDDAELQPGLIAIARRAFEPGGDMMIRDGFIPVVLIPVGEKLGIDHPGIRMPLVASQMMGLILMRYLLRAEPIASMDTDRLVATYAPVLQGFLTGPLP